MKVCLTERISKEYRQKADELKVRWQDRRALPDIIEDSPEKVIILVIPHTVPANDIDFTLLRNANILSKGKFVCCIADLLGLYPILQQEGIKYYCGFSLTSYEELRGAIAAGVSYVKIGAPLFFEMDNLKKLNVPPIRLTPNLLTTSILPTNSAHGTWVRPEDLHMYEDYIDVVEFEADKLSAEEAYYRIYIEQKTWPGPLSMLVPGLKDEKILNRLLLSDTSQARLNCGQSCEKNNHCHICDRSFHLASMRDELQEYKNMIDETNQQSTEPQN